MQSNTRVVVCREALNAIDGALSRMTKTSEKRDFCELMWETANPGLLAEINEAILIISKGGYSTNKLDYIVHSPGLFINEEKLSDLFNPDIWFFDPHGFPIVKRTEYYEATRELTNDEINWLQQEKEERKANK